MVSLHQHVLHRVYFVRIFKQSQRLDLVRRLERIGGCHPRRIQGDVVSDYILRRYQQHFLILGKEIDPDQTLSLPPFGHEEKPTGL